MRTLDEWAQTPCGCHRCRTHKTFYDSTETPPIGQCRKDIAYDSVLEQKARVLVRPWTSTTPFKPARSDQIALWASWISSSEDMSGTDVEAKRMYAGTRFDPVEVMRRVDGMFPTDLKKFQSGGYMRAFNAYRDDQFTLLRLYTSSIKTGAGYEVVENAYKALSTHINAHGDIVMGLPAKESGTPSEAIANTPAKIGRRAARRAKDGADE